MLSDLQKDLLNELLNTNIGFAASLLSEMVNQKVVLSVPSIDLKKGSEIDINSLISGDNDFKTSVLSTMKFGDDFQGNAYMVFPAQKAKYLVNACMGEENLPSQIFKLTSQDIDVIKEITNIVLNAVIGGFSNLLNIKLQYTIPNIEMTKVDDSEKGFLPENMHFLAMFNSFYLAKSQVRGLIFIALSVNSENMLINKLNEMLDDLND